MAKGVCRRAGATLRGLRSGASPRIGAVCPDLALAGHAVFFLSGLLRIVDYLNFVLLDLVHSPSRRTGERFPMAVDLAHNRVAAGLCHRNHVLDPLHVIKICGQRPDHDSVRSPASRGENVVDPVNWTGLEAPQAEGAPDEIDDLANPDILENVGWLYGCGNAEEKLVIGGGILALDERRRTKYVQSRGGAGSTVRRVRWAFVRAFGSFHWIPTPFL